MSKPPMIFLIGWFRSGTSMLWNLLRETDHYHCYYEPFHELLPQLAYTHCRHEIDPTHRTIDDYWAEYRAIPKEKLLTQWAPWYGRKRWRLTPDDQAPDMEAYIRFLAGHAAKAPVFKFVRATFRVSWLRYHFPDARIIWINRDPRQIWDSMQKRDEATATDPGNPQITQQGFSNYILQLALSLGFPIRDDLYGSFYEMWVSSYSEAQQYIDDTWWYDEILEDYPTWASKHLVQAGLTQTIPHYEIKTGVRPRYAKGISSYLATELCTPLPVPIKREAAPQRIVDEIVFRNAEIIDLKRRVLDLESALCRQREKALLASGNPAGFLKEKMKKNLIKLRTRLIKR